jgi:hypothetical protein
LTFRQPARIHLDLYLTVRHYFNVVDISIESIGYHYALETSRGNEIIVFHWHQDSQVRIPHLHIGSGAAVGRAELTAWHIPTGYVSHSELLFLLQEAAAGR